MGEKAAEFRAKGYLAVGLVYSLKATDGRCLHVGGPAHPPPPESQPVFFHTDDHIKSCCGPSTVCFTGGIINPAPDCPRLCVPVSLCAASLRSTQEEYQRKALGAFQRSGRSLAALCSLTHTHPPTLPSEWRCHSTQTALQAELNVRLDTQPTTYCIPASCDQPVVCRPSIRAVNYCLSLQKVRVFQ